MRKIIAIFLVMAICLLYLQCSKSTEPKSDNPPQTTPIDLTEAEKCVIESSNLFGFKLFQQIAADEEQNNNIFISPMSVSFALGMTWNGAGGETREAMASTLEMSDLTDQEINESYRNIMANLTQLDPEVIFKIANSIWYRIGKGIQPDFIEICQTYFDALVKEVNFQAPGTADSINNWVDVNTNGKIKEIIKPPIPVEVAMILMNAIYFKGTWTHLFDTADTHDDMFYLPDGSTTDCRMMNLEDTLWYFRNDLFQAVDLPYGDESFSMTILLPNYPATADDIIGELTAENWAVWMESFSRIEMPIHLPKFKFEYEKSLKDILISMGMGIAFLPIADFSNMFIDGIGWIDKVKHKTFVQVDEEGTEAAAVTIVIMIDSALPGMYINHPFLFVIHERDTGAILFMGKIADPIWEE
jgi:serine protease inhibitor